MATESKKHTTTQDDAIAMLTADHKKVKALFAKFAKLKEEGGEDQMAAVVEQICNELKVHTAVEEEIFIKH